ncbi:MAG: hypothetical protein DI585_07135 [Pseudomonas fluorescens]|nr:MAG: hypothetical protein DI585_07135 [Pseudomonas fluorescens]
MFTTIRNYIVNALNSKNAINQETQVPELEIVPVTELIDTSHKKQPAPFMPLVCDSQYGNFNLKRK